MVKLFPEQEKSPTIRRQPGILHKEALGHLPLQKGQLVSVRRRESALFLRRKGLNPKRTRISLCEMKGRFLQGRNINVNLAEGESLPLSLPFWGADLFRQLN